MRQHRIASAGIALTALLGGCNGGGGATPTPTPAAPAASPEAGPATLVAGATPEDLLSPSAFLEAPEAVEGRIGIQAAVFSVDADGGRLLLCDLSEAGCIGGD